MNARHLMVATLFILFSSMMFSAQAAIAQKPYTQNTMKLNEGTRPPATLQEAAWIVGHWRGEALGGIVEEIWAPPAGNSMMGMFRLVKEDGTVGFYEMLTLVEEEGSLIIRLKHFHADMKGWEEKDEVVEFPFVYATKERIFFDGMTFAKMGDEELAIYVANEQADGRTRELEFRLKKVTP